jgi:hypothetical protein
MTETHAVRLYHGIGDADEKLNRSLRYGRDDNEPRHAEMTGLTGKENRKSKVEKRI